VGKDARWAAVVTAPGQEFVAHNECRRFCLTCFLPQRRRRIFLKGATEPLMYAMPLIPRRVLMPLSQARDRALHYARGLKGPKFLVEGTDGKPFTVPDAAVMELCGLDRAGAFDDPPPGNAIRLTGRELLAAIAGEALAQAFAPIFVVPTRPTPKVSTQAEVEKELIEAGRPSQGQPGPLWVNPLQVSAAASRDVRERSYDDRSYAQKSAQSSAALAVVRLVKRSRFVFGAQAKAVGRPKKLGPKLERSEDQKEKHRQYMALFMREKRARQRAEISGSALTAV
jgi:hypothetical protein